jgi:hypothetical protein
LGKEAATAVVGFLVSPLRIHPDDAVFPARCYRCGDAATTSVDIERWRGVDLLVLRWGTTYEVTVPACRGCRNRRRFGLVAWRALLLALLAVPLGAVAFGRGLGWGELAYALGSLLGLPAVVLVWWIPKGAGPAFDRRFDALAIVDVHPDDGTVELLFRDDGLRADVASLSEAAR